MLAFADMMRKQIVMPAHLMDDGKHGELNSGRNLFEDFSGACLPAAYLCASRLCRVSRSHVRGAALPGQASILKTGAGSPAAAAHPTSSSNLLAPPRYCCRGGRGVWCVHRH